MHDKEGNVNAATLRWGDSLSIFYAEAEEIGSTGFGTAAAGEAPPVVAAYRFPDD